MSTRIRLSRHGKKRYAYYHIVVADQRAKRDGKSIERLGEYDPNSDPAIINLDFDRALYWLQNGAEPSDTMRAILSYKGVLYKNHLLNGVKKGAHTEEEVEKKFQAWLDEKDGRIQAKRDSIKKRLDADAGDRLAAEAKIKDARATEILAKQAPPEAPVAEGEEAPATEAPATEAPAAEAAPVTEEVAAVEEPKKEEPKAEEPKKEEPKAEEPKKEEPKKEEAPAAKAEDLTKIEGIGPKIAEVLTGKGIGTFAALAAADAADIKKILEEAEGNFGSHVPDTWPQQAKLAADGKWDELKKWQDELDGGKPSEDAPAPAAASEEEE